ncbi:MAG: CDP-alcohol phosphatidyltransferase family protein, partial [Lawsonibacter sp.]
MSGKCCCGGDPINYLANIISASRFIFAVLIICAEPFSVLFWAAYVCGGLSDLIDGPIARGLNQLSEAGAKLDSLADLVFM